jgi:PAS domain S-box-containing protein/putative nucleotidyltransferase with HDIG domain
MRNKVLIVDDDDTNIYLLKNQLESQGFDVVAAKDGREALETARADPPDLIVSDILMPVMDGYTLCREWKSDERLRKIPFVFYTATYTEPKDEKFALGLGASRFLLKPQEPGLLMEILNRVLEENSGDRRVEAKPLGEEMEFFRRHNEILFRKLEKKMVDLERVNREIRAVEEMYRLSFGNVTDVVYTIDNDLHVLSMSPSIETHLGFKPEDFVGRPVSCFSRFLTPESFRQATDDMRSVLKGEAGREGLYEFIARDGGIRFGEVSTSPVMREGRISGIIAVARDITNRRLAEEKLRESEERYRTLFEKTSNPILVIDAEGNYIGGNKAALQFLECTEEQLLAKHVRDTLLPGERSEALLEKYRFLWKSGGRTERVYLVNGKTKTLDLTVIPCLWHGKSAIVGLGTDITDRKQAEEKLIKSEQRYRLLVENANEAIMVVQDGMVRFVNAKAVESYGYSEQEFLATPIFDLVHPEDREEVAQRYLQKIQGNATPTRNTFRTLHKSGRIMWIVISSVLIEWEGRPATLNLIVDMTEQKKAEEMLLNTTERLRRSLAGTVQAITMAVETRDPYTAGHQKRAADLARAIAMELGFSADRIEFVRIATSIHDIGKISVPAEILSKPTKLRELEYELIKSHAQAGYDILKDVEFPWPVAEAVRQHHERMDGSGYPRGLRGEEILMEARIMAAADVVEAIASHRPYRPASGIDTALSEIRKNRGILYDPEVTDACLRLFTERRYCLI